MNAFHVAPPVAVMSLIMALLALTVPVVCEIVAALPLVVPQRGSIYWATLVAITGLLLWEHSLVRPDDLSRVNEAFFTANAAIGLLLLVAIAVDGRG
jgi:4-hydroxybenzoate polyprenyltransferase